MTKAQKPRRRRVTVYVAQDTAVRLSALAAEDDRPLSAVGRLFLTAALNASEGRPPAATARQIAASGPRFRRRQALGLKAVTSR